MYAVLGDIEFDLISYFDGLEQRGVQPLQLGIRLAVGGVQHQIDAHLRT
ncbi:hypothetical protein [Chromobacterium phragmitis]|uniref:Uncharacterized protein n=1 Tax=Chromobacterium phragmitis TaxID=2202141 RepID=A0ABV0IWE7_9NEIS